MKRANMIQAASRSFRAALRPSLLLLSSTAFVVGMANSALAAFTYTILGPAQGGDGMLVLETQAAPTFAIFDVNPDDGETAWIINTEFGAGLEGVESNIFDVTYRLDNGAEINETVETVLDPNNPNAGAQVQLAVPENLGNVAVRVVQRRSMQSRTCKLPVVTPRPPIAVAITC